MSSTPAPNYTLTSLDRYVEPGNRGQDQNGNEWVYVRASAAIAAQDLVLLTIDGTTVTAAPAGTDATYGGVLGVAYVAFVAEEYGWAQVYGVATVTGNAAVATGAAVGIAADGQIGAETTGNATVLGVLPQVASTAAGPVTVWLNWPNVGPTGT